MKRIPIVIAVLLALLALFGCGQKTPAPPPTATTAPTPEVTEAPTATPEITA
ncbi:MAG: hypothetical protein GX549_06960, partial [Clostridiales bacterium]|nr:hypothetical protein [Clostridiales bacterium]